jgi:HEAT repeat protein
MAKARPIEERLAELKALGAQGKTEAVVAAVRSAIADKNNLIAARGATIAAELKIESVENELVAAFARFMADGGKSDKGCSAKTAIVRALDGFGAQREEIYLAGVKHVQHEPTWGGQSDTAGELRGASAFALININYRGAINEIVPLLVDADAGARLAGVRAVAGCGKEASEPLLRLKALSGDKETGVIGECLLGLLRGWPGASAGFVEAFLERPDLKETALVALGESRRPEALAVLKRFYEKSLDDANRGLALSAMALLRLEEAVEFMLSVVADERARGAALAVKALKIYRSDEKVRQRVEAIAKERDDMVVTETVKEVFADA